MTYEDEAIENIKKDVRIRNRINNGLILHPDDVSNGVYPRMINLSKIETFDAPERITYYNPDYETRRILREIAERGISVRIEGFNKLYFLTQIQLVTVCMSVNWVIDVCLDNQGGVK